MSIASYLCLHLPGDHNALHGCVYYLGFASLPAKSATANVLSPADYENFHNLDLKMLTIGDDLYALVTNRPAAQAPDCLMQLAFKFDAVQADLRSLGYPGGTRGQHG